MMSYISKQNILKAVFITWVVLWALFLIREEKTGEYDRLMKLYASNDGDKIKEFMGEDLYDFLTFVRENVPEGSDYRFEGFERFSVHAVRGRYYLWPSKGASENPEYIVVYGKEDLEVPGYEFHSRYKDSGSKYILRKN